MSAQWRCESAKRGGVDEELQELGKGKQADETEREHVGSSGMQLDGNVPRPITRTPFLRFTPAHLASLPDL